jgi:hypothetical protein
VRFVGINSTLKIARIVVLVRYNLTATSFAVLHAVLAMSTQPNPKL